MLRLRFARRGKKNQAFYRLVAAESKKPIKGRFLEIVGFFNPYTKEAGLKKDRIKYWLSVGAQPSDSVHNLLIEHKIIKGKKINKFRKKAKEKKQKQSAKRKEPQTAPEKPKLKKEAKTQKAEEPKAK